MKITGDCQECKKEKAVVAFKGSVGVSVRGRERQFATTGKAPRKLCSPCFSKALKEFANLARDVQS